MPLLLFMFAVDVFSSEGLIVGFEFAIFVLVSDDCLAISVFSVGRVEEALSLMNQN